MNSSLVSLFNRDLDRLKTEVQLYNSDEHFWEIKNEIQNSAGNLTIHLIGNLNHFIGAILGNSGYIRNRDAEFNTKNIPQKHIMAEIDAVKTTIEHVITNLTKEDLDTVFPINIGNKDMTTEQFLIHLYGHLNYHLGQINYHRRLIN